MRWEQSIQYASRSDIGFRRKNNQDSLAVQTCPDEETFNTHGHLFLVADGMGGHAVGELASKIAADTIPHNFYKSREANVGRALKNAIEAANANIHERGSQNQDFERMGTTCSALVLAPDGASIGHVGDSRVYRVRQERIDQLTFDHSLQWELIRQGQMPADEVFLYEPRHVITRSLGPDSQVEVDIEGPYTVLPGDTYVICSDGLTNHVNDEEIGMIAGGLPPGEACRLLVNLSNLRGGSDNVTVVIARVGDLPAGVEPVRDDSVNGGGDAPSLNWKWLSGFWAGAIGFVAGVSLVLFGYLVFGGLLAGGAVIGLLGLTLAWWKARAAVTQADAGGEETVLWRPYATAGARLTKRFLNHLAAVESELQHTATEEKWPVDWSVHGQEFQEVKATLTTNQHVRTFRALARSIDALMIGLHEQRRQLQHGRRWGRVTANRSESSG